MVGSLHFCEARVLRKCAGFFLPEASWPGGDQLIMEREKLFGGRRSRLEKILSVSYQFRRRNVHGPRILCDVLGVRPEQRGRNCCARICAKILIESDVKIPENVPGLEVKTLTITIKFR